MRLRIRFTKAGKLRWTSHRDLARIWERALRKAGLPLAYSAGFSPRPRISFGLALPTGAESRAEYLDLDLAEDLTGPQLAALPGRLGAELPEGMAVEAACPLAGSDVSLQHDVVACGWQIELDPGYLDSRVESPPLAEGVAALLAAPSVLVTRQRKGQESTDDIRPAILDLRVEPGPPSGSGSGPGAVFLVAELATQPRGLRPGELLGALGIDPTEARVLRTHQWIERDGARREPLPAPDAPPAVRQAS